ncbi:SDR family NAD(P)-dependent oxidoreductase [Bacillus sp. CGMCC 1.16607]|uniref:SDR family NAD(P)-dependent oxidoreductase n=1 Tax=Bacillus sp. CGMCC 1.16607 TaxID=3351842 RepID=UPI003625AE62
MKKALVLGASGGMGYSLVEELVSRNIETIAFARTKGKLEKYEKEWGPLAKIMVGDVLNHAQLKEAISKVDVVFHAISIPYQNWDPSLFNILSLILQECKLQKKSLIYVDNIYAYGVQRQKVNELTTKNPHTKKGKIRLNLQQQIENSGVPYVIAHFPDFYGPKAENTALQYTFEQIVKKNSGGFVGNPNLQREFIYIKDAAKALVELSLHDDAYGEIWTIPGAGTISGKEIGEIASKYLSKEIKLNQVHNWMIKALGIFNPFMREYYEMLYLNENPVILDGTKYENRIGALPKTPFTIGIRNNLEEIAKQWLVKK